jgi:predicted aspartyl protease
MERRTLQFLIFAILLITASARTGAESAELAGKVVVKADSVIVYSEMSTASEQVKSLHKGDVLKVEYELESSEGAWCAVAEQDQSAVSGYVQCKYLQQEETRKERWQHVGSSVRTTKVIVMGNQVLVPVELGYKDKTVSALFLLDTGASISLINTKIATRLGIKPSETKARAGEVIGGGLILVSIAKMSHITIGPHTRNEMEIGVVVHRGPPVSFDGLLGMDFLRGLKYNVDFESETLIWQ